MENNLITFIKDMSPEILLCVGIVFNIVCALFHKSVKPRVSNILSIILFALSLALSLFEPPFFRALLYVCAFVSCVFAIKFTKRLTHKTCYFNALLFALTLGGVFLISSTNFLTMFVSLEIVSVSSYLLVALFLTKKGLEASVKYFIQGAVATCLALFAISYIYALFGTLSFSQISQMIPGTIHSGLLPLANAILFCALAFKLAAVPFCSWLCETIEGADYSVGLVLSTVSKVAAIALFVKLAWLLAPIGTLSQLVLILIALSTLVFANLLALRQKNIKRFMAYSTISHMGYMLFAASILTSLSVASAVFYLVAYLVATFGVWAGFGMFHLNDKTKENLEDMTSVAYQNPMFATMMAICLFSLAGMPPMLGFVSKFYMFVQILSAGIWTTIPMLVLIFASGVAMFYYVRIITLFYKRGEAIKLAKKTTIARIILTIASFLLIVLIFFTKPIIGLCSFM